MIRILDTTTHDDVLQILRQRSVHRDDQTESVVKQIIADVRQRGDAALLENARRFDAQGLESLVVSEEEIASAVVPAHHELAIRTAYERVLGFHQTQLARITEGWIGSKNQFRWSKGDDPGIGQRLLPVSSAGVYVPGGNATYPSSVIMNAAPGFAANVSDIAVTTPARADGTLADSVLLALRTVGVKRAYKIGGAAAIAALALGTETIKRVDKIVGPGNRFVNEAKHQLWGQVGLDGYAGPSEVCVLADDAADPRFAAADLLTQIEHAPDNAGFLVTLSRAKLDQILQEAEAQLKGAPREATMRQALREQSLAIVARDLTEALDLVNEIAPEHLTLAVKDPAAAMEGVQNAGCILLGEQTPESAGDFCLGASHTLPTSGAARWQSPVNVLDFLKLQSVARLSSEALQPLIPVIEAFGEMEGFPTHGFGASIRRT
ncbi:histidinol dehydrogenase [Fimbriimonas ginsengisoli]|uniref:Histidinol dehydrogenase n=1 Tax=Fimbriimonas ginsengisoli Gsoil 348 TaxID=661478 RepID=A0A068NJF6_FIMGI|nr:histidinol dehydrogenase [Fimbriimonas ginsengisoli]AIE83626.1 Histidinol dehydrogenase [Fimbriimonas ginsengisoli Gsoil 348]